MVKVSCRITEYSDRQKPDILVHNHWNENKKIEIEVNGERYVVVADDLIAAIKNCTNTNKY